MLFLLLLVHLISIFKQTQHYDRHLLPTVMAVTSCSIVHVNFSALPTSKRDLAAYRLAMQLEAFYDNITEKI